MSGIARGITDRRFFALASAAIALLVFVGFSRSYYLKILFGTPALSLRLHIHGVIMTVWIVLFGVQTALIASKRVVWHRRLGWFGVAAATLVVLSAANATITAAAREVRGHTPDAAIVVPVLALELTQIFMYAGFVAAAVIARNRVGHHKRYMLLATFCLLANPIVRIPETPINNVFNLALLYLFALVFVSIDIFRSGKLHPAFGWGFTIFVVVMQMSYFVAYSEDWLKFATHAVS